MTEAPRPPELVAAQWRKEVCKYLMDLAGMVALGGGLSWGHGDDEVSIQDFYGVIVALIGPDGVGVAAHGQIRAGDITRTRDAVWASFNPEEAAKVRVWEAAQQAVVDAYEARAFPCEMGCSDRFETARGLATHYAAARRRGDRDYRHAGHELRQPPTARRPNLGLVG